jgi:hypothetical protein
VTPAEKEAYILEVVEREANYEWARRDEDFTEFANGYHKAKTPPKGNDGGASATRRSQ